MSDEQPLTFIRDHVTNLFMASFHDLTTAQLKQAVQIREQIESLQEKLDALLGGSSTSTKKQKVSRTKGKRTMSPATIEKMRAAQQARWAKINGKSSTKAAPVKAALKAEPKKKGFSAETRAKLAAAMKARWAAKKKAHADTV